MYNFRINVNIKQNYKRNMQCLIHNELCNQMQLKMSLIFYINKYNGIKAQGNFF